MANKHRKVWKVISWKPLSGKQKLPKKKNMLMKIGRKLHGFVHGFCRFLGKKKEKRMMVSHATLGLNFGPD
jgi:hypothetical protein